MGLCTPMGHTASTQLAVGNAIRLRRCPTLCHHLFVVGSFLTIRFHPARTAIVDYHHIVLVIIGSVGLVIIRSVGLVLIGSVGLVLISFSS